MSAIKKLFGQVAVYGVSSILARAVNFLLVPFYTEYFEPDVFGIYSEYMSYTAFFLVFFTFGLETSYFRYAGKELEEEKAFSQFFTKVFVLACVGSGLLFFFAHPLSLLLKESGNALYIRVLAVVLFMDVAFSISFARLRNLNKGKKFAMIKFLAILINVVLNVLLIRILPIDLKIQGLLIGGELVIDFTDQVLMILLANLLSNSVFLIFFFPDFKMLFKHFNKKFFKPIFKYAYPVMILGLASIINELLDRIMLKEYLPDGFYPDFGWTNLDAIGVYSANYKFAIFITLAIQAYRYAAEPFFFKKADDKDSKETFVQLMNVFVILLLIAALSISVFKQEIGYLLLRQPEYREGLYVVPILLFANVCVGIYYNLSAWYKLTDKTIYGTYIGIGGAIITIVLNFLLIPYYGFLGSAIATLVCYFLMMLSCYLFGQRYYPVKYDLKRILSYSILTIIGVAVSHFIIESLDYSWVYKVLLVLFYLGVIYFFDVKKWLKT